LIHRALISATLCGLVCLGDVRTARAQCDLDGSLFVPSDGSSADKAGTSVAISGAQGLVGVPFDDDRAANAGAAYIYRFNGTAWVQGQKLTAPDGAAEDRFGYGVGISGNIAVVGAFGDDDKGSNAGAAYIFRNNGSSWVFEQKLLAADGAAGDSFGFSVGASGTNVLVGAYGDDDRGANSGAAYVFRNSGSTWTQAIKLAAADGAAYDYFGVAVALSGDYALIGADLDDDVAANAGSAYVYRYNGSAWAQDAKLTASNGVADDHFGISVAIEGTLAVVGADESDNAGPASGAAYAFRKTGSQWIEEGRLVPWQAAGYESFGAAVGVSGSRVVVGAPNAKDMSLAFPRTDQGAIYLFTYSAGAWAGVERVFAWDGWSYNLFGASVAAAGEAMIIGSPGDANNGTDAGTAYVYEGTCAAPGCTANSQCNDNNPCTNDSCVAGECVFANNTAACNDNNACTTGDRCTAGVCAGTPMNCADSMPCTVDSCVNGVCQHDSAACGCTSNTQCNDNNACTSDTCSSGVCVHVNNTITCNDGNACTINDRCANGACAGTAMNCDDGLSCSADSCVNGVCQHNTAACQCTSNTQCNDNNACTTDTCVGGSCQHANNTAACNDGNACTTNDFCSNGVCRGTTMNCDDSNPCTNDSCSNGTCVRSNNTNTCNDNNACTTNDRCAAGLCLGTAMNCDDGLACSVDSCANGVCQHNTAACGCTSHSQCNDNNPCTNDFCNAGTCLRVNNTNPCNDNNACTSGDVCAAGACTGTPVSCSDGNPCTNDSCSNGACWYTNNTSTCNDGNSCTTSDRCGNGACSGTPMTCSDGVTCTVDFCVNGACVFDAANCECSSDAECDDNDSCTTDRCSGGSCSHTLMSVCCGNGTCETTESSCTCPDDCGAAGSGAVCGNGVCEAGDGEDCRTCSADCNGRQYGPISGWFCCGAGGGVNPVSCADIRCESNWWSCTNEPTDLCCGDGQCAAGETACDCAEDCGAPAAREIANSTCSDGLDNDCDGQNDCGDTDCSGDPACWACNYNGLCQAGEDCKSCPSDCAGEPNGRRTARYCCGNGILESPEVGSVCDGNP
jgi:hypothetical protein